MCASFYIGELDLAIFLLVCLSVINLCSLMFNSLPLLGSSWTSTPSVSRQRTVSERGDSTVDNKSVVSKTSNRANAYRQKVCDSPYSHIASVSCVGCGNTSDYSTTTAGTGTLTSLLGRLLTFGSRDGFASSFLPPEGSLHSVVHPGAGESCKKGDIH